MSLPSLRELLLLFALSLLCLQVIDLQDMGSYIQVQAAVFEAEGETLPLLYASTLCLKSAPAPTERSLLQAAPRALPVLWDPAPCAHQNSSFLGSSRRQEAGSSGLGRQLVPATEGGQGPFPRATQPQRRGHPLSATSRPPVSSRGSPGPAPPLAAARSGRQLPGRPAAAIGHMVRGVRAR